MKRIKNALKKISDELELGEGYQSERGKDFAGVMDSTEKSFDRTTGDDIHEFAGICYENVMYPLKLECDYWWEKDKGVFFEGCLQDQDLLDDAAKLGLDTNSLDEAKEFMEKELTQKLMDEIEESADQLIGDWEMREHPEYYIPEGHVHHPRYKHDKDPRW
jgi:hypothetical protein